MTPGQPRAIFQTATATWWSVFSPTYNHQFAGGFVRGRWYVAPVGDAWVTPLSPPYGTREEAIQAVNPISAAVAA